MTGFIMTALYFSIVAFVLMVIICINLLFNFYTCKRRSWFTPPPITQPTPPQPERKRRRLLSRPTLTVEIPPYPSSMPDIPNPPIVPNVHPWKPYRTTEENEADKQVRMHEWGFSGGNHLARPTSTYEEEKIF